MGLVCLVCGNETDLELLLSLPDDGLLCCPRCDGLDVPGATSASGLTPASRAPATTTPSHEAA